MHGMFEGERFPSFNNNCVAAAPASGDYFAWLEGYERPTMGAA